MPNQRAGWESEVDELFRRPEVPHAELGTVSTLHLLRREIVMTLIDLTPVGNVMISEERAAAEAAKSPQRLFASTSLLCTGMDLLATLSYGDTGAIGQRFMRLLRQAAPQRFDAIRARRVWALRNGLAHSFGFRAHARKRRNQRGKAPLRRRNYARLTDVKVALLAQPLQGKPWRVDKRQWIISVQDLFNAFLEILAEREKWFRKASGPDRRRLRTMIRRYGQIRIGAR